MKILTDFHTHTVYSKNNHGKGTIRENVEVAIEKGLKELWITDHGPSHIMFGIKRSKFREVRQEIDRLNREFQGIIDIYFGLEANVMNYKGTIDIGEEEMQYLDGINVGFHYGIINPNLRSFFYFWIVNPLSKLIRPLKPWIAKKNTDALIAILENYDIQIITHPGDKVPVDIERLAQACVRTNTALEINASHENLTVADAKKIYKTGVMYSLGSDAHNPRRVGDLDEAIRRAKQAGISPERIINQKA